MTKEKRKTEAKRRNEPANRQNDDWRWLAIALTFAALPLLRPIIPPLSPYAIALNRVQGYCKVQIIEEAEGHLGNEQRRSAGLQG